MNDRNNTNFPVTIHNKILDNDWSLVYKHLKNHQKPIVNYVLNEQKHGRGVVIVHDMGMGKSITASTIMLDSVNTKNKNGQPYVIMFLASKSLHSNMQKSLKKTIKLSREYNPDSYDFIPRESEQIDTWIENNFSYLSTNASNLLKKISRIIDPIAAKEMDVEKKIDKKEGVSAADIRSREDKLYGSIVKMGNLNGKILIFDEAHNFFNSITNGSMNAMALYDLIMKSNDVKLIFLTGTFVTTNIFELVPCFNMLHGYHKPGPDNDATLFPEDYDTFRDIFVDESGNIKNKHLLQNRIFGLVSSVQRPENSPDYPVELEPIIKYVPMAQKQWTAYKLAREAEDEEAKRGAKYKSVSARMQKPKSAAASTYKVLSRQRCNLFRDDEGVLHSTKIEVSLDIMKDNGIFSAKKRKGIIYSQFIEMGLAEIKNKMIEHNYKEKIAKDGLILLPAPSASPVFATEILPEFDQVIPAITGGVEDNFGDDTYHDYNLVGENGKYNLYKNTYDYEGKVAGKQYVYNIIAQSAINRAMESPNKTINILNADGISVGTITYATVTGGADHDIIPDIISAPSFSLVTGEVSANDKIVLQDMFNKSIVDVLLISGAVAEGIDLKGGTFAILFESYWSDNKHLQVVKRISRYQSHAGMAEEDKIVQAYVLLAVPPVDVAGEVDPVTGPNDDQQTTDTSIYFRAKYERNIIKNAINIIKAASIECGFDHNLKKVDGCDCKICIPNNKKLFGRIMDDLNKPDPCNAVKKTTVSATKIKVDDADYFYIPSAEGLYGYNIFYYDSTLKVNVQMPEDDKLFKTIIAAIKSGQ